MYLYVILETLLAVVLGVTDKSDKVFSALINSTFYGTRAQTLVKFSSIVWDGGWRITCKEENYIELTRKRDGNIITCWADNDGTIYLAWYDSEVELIDLQIV